MGWLMALVGALVGCREGRAPLGEQGGAPGLDEQAWAVDTWPAETWPADDFAKSDLAALQQPSLSLEPEDVALCQALADRQRLCVDDEADPFDVDGCADRYACSRQLWREDIQEAVYDCLQERPCDEADPEFACLREATAELQPSTAQQRFEREAAAADELCGNLLEVAPGQSDLVYGALTFCLTQNESCDSQAACSLATLDALVDEVCGATLAGPAAQDA